MCKGNEFARPSSVCGVIHNMMLERGDSVMIKSLKEDMYIMNSFSHPKFNCSQITPFNKHTWIRRGNKLTNTVYI